MTRAIRLLGLPGLAGVGLLVAAVLLWRFDLAALNEREAALTKRLETDQRSRPGHSNVVAAPSLVAAERLKTYYGFFTQSGRATDTLARLYAVGKHLGLEPGRAEYRLEPLRDSPLFAYTVTVPVAGSYGAIRTYVEHALHQLPQASLDAARFERRGSSNAVEATLTFTLFLATP